MKRTCSITALLALGLFALYLGVTWQIGRMALGGAALLALVCTVGGLFGLNLITDGIYYTRAALALRRAGRYPTGTRGVLGGAPPLRDGRFEVVAGPIVAIAPLHDALVSPIAGEPCVLYRYDAFAVETGGTGSQTRRHDLAGAALIPCAVASPRGTVALRGMPLLDELPLQTQTYDELTDAARRSVAATPFTTLPRTVQSVALIEDTLAADGTALRHDWSLGDAVVDDRTVFEERSVGVGSEVCVFGRYSAATQSLGHDGGWMLVRGGPLKLFPGSIEDTRRTLRTSLLITAPVSLLVFAVSHGILVAVLINGASR